MITGFITKRSTLIFDITSYETTRYGNNSYTLPSSLLLPHTFQLGVDPLESRIKCLVSTGIGVPSSKSFQDDVFHIGKTLIAIATETEQTAETFRRDKSSLDSQVIYTDRSLN